MFTKYFQGIKMLIKNRICTIRNKKRIALLFDYNEDVITLVKQIEGRKWSASNKFWHIPFFENYLEKLNLKFNGKLEFIESTTEKTEKEKSVKNHFPPEYLETLKLKNYSEPTIKTYCLYFQRFLNYYNGTEIKAITHEQIRKYLLYLVEEKKYSTSAQNQAINSIKFYYEKVLGKPVEKYYIPRSRKELKLPVVLSKREVKQIIDCTNNLKHKAILSTIYSAGLRLSEVVNLKIADIDSERKLIYIRGGKSKKDRTTILSTELLALLRKYFKDFKPKIWLFEGVNGGQYSKRSVQEIFYKALKKQLLTKKYQYIAYGIVLQHIFWSREKT